jgi:hypothetical protein
MKPNYQLNQSMFSITLIGIIFNLISIISWSGQSIAYNFQPHYLASNDKWKYIEWQWTQNRQPIGPMRGFWLQGCRTYQFEGPDEATDNTGWWFSVSETCPIRQNSAAFDNSKAMLTFESFFDIIHPGQGYFEILYPWLESTDPALSALYIGFDLATYYSAGGAVYLPGQVFSVVNGLCPQLPGYIFGTSEVYYDSIVGWNTDNLLSGNVTPIGSYGMCVPLPTPILLMGSGFIILYLIRKRC